MSQSVGTRSRVPSPIRRHPPGNRISETAAIGGLISVALLAFISAWEGERLMPYRDVIGIWTVCRGHTGADVIPGQAWSRARCDEVTREDLTHAAVGLLSCTTYSLNQNQFEALVSWTYNVGVYRACGSTLVRGLNMGNIAIVQTELLKWVNAGGKRVQGLVNRRVAELALFNKPVTWTPYDPPASASARSLISAFPNLMTAPADNRNSLH